MKTLHATLTCTYDGAPLAMVDGLPGDHAELRPEQMRALAAALLRLADDAATRKLMHRGKPAPVERKAYPLQP